MKTIYEIVEEKIQKKDELIPKRFIGGLFDLKNSYDQYFGDFLYFLCSYIIKTTCVDIKKNLLNKVYEKNPTLIIDLVALLEGFSDIQTIKKGIFSESLLELVKEAEIRLMEDLKETYPWIEDSFNSYVQNIRNGTL